MEAIFVVYFQDKSMGQKLQLIKKSDRHLFQAVSRKSP